MNRTAGRIILACLTLMVITGCRTSAIYNVKETQIITATGKEPSLEAVTKAIVEAGREEKWAMQVEQPGHIVGRLNIRSHTAIVEIPYNTKTYSITYKDSTNLKYDKSDSTIHSNYNSWIENLDAAIKRHLSLIG